ncbi:hypothetical protein FS842_007600, partial [Serendipita sp. 407]
LSYTTNHCQWQTSLHLRRGSRSAGTDLTKESEAPVPKLIHDVETLLDSQQAFIGTLVR